ncbi:HalX domain-containing protein [Natronorubrum sulfidifaciens]|uniref:Response regulator receiver protein n=1 Tax=Natronorubrum sulfidifaciens JCM 14089 TaxID=1230460 RepID=L9WE83_9EURY|nr:HalX domain-containing protein [Natronorubrum sulfidifaciens]ELY46618.1 response regulator receiver protein [Natronorubrum sulfidifaciens JCM 14089]
METSRSRVAIDVHRADFDQSILEQIGAGYDLLVLDWGLETPDARGVLDAFQQSAPETQILVLSEDVPTDDPVDRGANELLVGPHSDERLCVTIERLLLQGAYEEAMNEFFRLSTERALLESELQSDIDAADRYQSIVCNLYESRKRAAEIRDELSVDEFDQSLRQLLDE